MTPSRRIAVLAVVGMLVVLAAGCPSLSLFSSTHYHEVPETKQRLDSLEKRVTALENGGVGHSGQAPIRPNTSPQFWPAQAP